MEGKFKTDRSEQMKKKLNYCELIKSWMQLYGLTVELSRNLFSAIWMRMQNAKTEALEDGGEERGIHLELFGREREE